jgi:hypothetical protein
MSKKIISNRNFKKGERLVLEEDYENAAKYFEKQPRMVMLMRNFLWFVIYGWDGGG